MTDKHEVQIRVIYGDTDAMGIVYHTNYIRWFEVGRTELFRANGIVYADLEKKGYNLPLTKVFCHYLIPTKYDEILHVETDLDYIKRASMKFNYVIRSEDRQQIRVTGYTVHACTNVDGKIVRIPEEITHNIHKIN